MLNMLANIDILRYCMVRSALWNIKYPTPRAEPEGEGLYIPEFIFQNARAYHATSDIIS